MTRLRGRLRRGADAAFHLALGVLCRLLDGPEPRRLVVDRWRGIPIPPAWRGNCPCGRWRIVVRGFTLAHPLECECGRFWFIDPAGKEAMFYMVEDMPG